MRFDKLILEDIKSVIVGLVKLLGHNYELVLDICH